MRREDDRPFLDLAEAGEPVGLIDESDPLPLEIIGGVCVVDEHAEHVNRPVCLLAYSFGDPEGVYHAVAVPARGDLDYFHLDPSLREMISSTMAVAAAGIVQSERAAQARSVHFARAIALVTDMLLFGLLSFVVNSVYGVTQITSGSPPSGSIGFASYSTNTAVPWYVLTALGLLYFTVPEALFGATPGKYWANLRVVSADGMALSLRAVFIRNVMRLVDYLPVLYLLGGVSVRFTAYSQRLGDRAAGTTVVHRNHALIPGATRASSPRAKRIAGIGLVAAFVFTLAFNYFGRPPLLIEGLYNERLLPMGDGGYTLASPHWSLDRVTYHVTGKQAGSGHPCTGSITFEWSWMGWQNAGSGFTCQP
jgi:uncharacterized RDD family membrane protein YckC